MKMAKLLSILILVLALILPGAFPGRAQDVTTDLLGRINGLRQSLGVHPYSHNGILAAAANNQAQWMVSTGQVNHTQDNGSTPRSRAISLGYASGAVSENIYMGSNATAESAWNWWLNSAIHYRGITNSAYTEVGIGHAVGEYGQAFVLVFGNPNGWGVLPGSPGSSPSGSNNSGSAGSANVAPSFVVGVDAVGNIMHEIQPGDTLGDIAFLYGYDWDDLERIRQLNELTEEEGRNLLIGEVLLIPPYNGTFTPTPGGPPPTATSEAPGDDAPSSDNGDQPSIQPAQVTPGPTENAIVLQSDALEFQTITPTDISDLGILPTASDTPTTDSAALIPTGTPVTTATQSWIAVTVTPSPQPIAVADASGIRPDTVITAPTSEVIVQQRVPTWLIVIIVIQAGVIIGAGFEFIRRRRS